MYSKYFVLIIAFSIFELNCYNEYKKGYSSIPMFINRLRENKSGLQTETEGNTSTIRKKPRNIRTLKCNKKQTTMKHT